MIQLARLPRPDILARKHDVWTQRYLAKRAKEPNARPHTDQYAHREIKDELAAMSHHKCFYCETRLDENEYTVDHYVEVNEAPERAFDWANLYLACEDCQGKLSEQTVPRADCLDPCDPDVDPAEHLVFEDEIIRPRDASARGRATIRKYKLDRGDHELRRLRQLDRFRKVLLVIREHQIRDGGRPLTQDERSRIRRYGQAEQPYAAMFRDILAGYPELAP